VSEGRVVGVQRTPGRRLPPERLTEASVRANWGIEGDRHARPGSSRQVVFTQSEVLDDLRLGPGATREQLTISGLGDVAIGDIVAIGTVRLEVAGPRVPCRVMDGIRPGLMEELRGRGGWCTRVLTGGTVRPGDVAVLGRAGVDDPPWLVAYLEVLGAWEAASAQPPDDGWSTFAERFAHLIAWDQRGAERIEALATGAPSQTWGPTDIDAFNAAAIERWAGRDDLWVLHDDWSTAVVDAARRWPDQAEAWVRSLTAHYREHT
jgi:hypothetical protein